MVETIGFGLDGGGFPGVKQVGPLEEAETRGKMPNMLLTVSVGALNGAKFVESGSRALKEYWLGVEERGPSSVFNFNKWQVAKRIMRKESSFLPSTSLDILVGTLNMRKILESPIELRVVVKNESRNATMVFSSHHPEMRSNPEKFRQIIKASASLPPIFPPVMIDGERFSDGYHLPLKEFKDFDLVVILINDDPGLTDLVSGGDWRDRASLGQREMTDDFTPETIENFLFRNPKFNKLSVNSGLRRLREWVVEFIAEFAEFIRASAGKEQSRDDVPKHRFVVVTPNYNIPTLRLHKFNPGDITRAIKESRRQAKEVFDDLFPETKSPS